MHRQQSVPFGRRGAHNVTKAPAPFAGRQMSPKPPKLTYAQLLEAAEQEPADDAWPAGAAYAAGYEADDLEMSLFIGPNWGRYRDLWRAMKGNGALKSSFSIEAFSFSWLWLLYRRLNGAAAAVLGCELAVTFFSPAYFPLVQFALCLLVGLWGKALVIQRGMETIAVIARSGLSSSAARIRVERLGGTRLLPPLVVSLLLPLVFFASVTVRLSRLEDPTQVTPWQEIQNAPGRPGAAP